MFLPSDHFSVFFVLLVAASVSAFCSAAEAVFFSLTAQDRTAFRCGGRLQQLAASLSRQSGKILPAVLWCNLTANLVIFACLSIAALAMQKNGQTADAGLFALVSLFMVIICCELIPKSLGVTIPRLLAPLLALPLSLMIRLIGPMIPWLQRINTLSQRLICPNLKPESTLLVSDLERMIELTPSRGKKPLADRIAQSLSLLPDEAEQPATLLRREQQVLRNIVGLSDATAEEMMRPRTRLRLFKPPVTLASLQDGVPSDGYLLITEPDTDEIASAIPLHRSVVAAHGDVEVETVAWDAQSNPVVYVPWRMKVSHVLETLQKERKEVAAVVNEYGETIGILTFDDLVYSIFALVPSRSRLLFNQAPVRHGGEGRRLVSTMTTLR
ncbi:MAG: CNNM domain-containing protein, partial [Planctomycetaceae bacterium]|nr:CNNM domain-containing protein [Planctomycetaceae bacterium]